MAAISNVGIKLAGSHAGVSIGEDGPSQMALEDLAMCRAEPNYTVLYPCDAVSTERLVALMAYHPGPAYMRTSRPKTPVIYAQRRDVHDRRAEGAARERRRRRDRHRRRRHRVRGAEGVRSAEGRRHRDSRHRSLLGAPVDRGRARRRRARDRRAPDHGRGSLRGRRHRRRGGRGGGRRRLHRPSPRRPRDSAQRKARGAARALRHLRDAHRRGRQAAEVRS